MHDNANDKKILYIFDHSDWKSRLPIAYKAQENSYNVTIALVGAPKNDQNIQIPDFKTLQIATPQGQMKAGNLMKMVKTLRRVIAQENPSLVHTVTLKYAFVTGLAVLSFKSMRKIYTLAGLGYLFRSTDKKARLIRAVLKPLLSYVLKAPNTILIFQNPDDLNLMVDGGYATAQRSVLIRGSGVDLNHFTPCADQIQAQGDPIVLMPTRLVHEKGVEVFVEAARELKKSDIVAIFQIAGGETRHNPKAISREEMLDMTKDGVVEWLGRVDDMPAMLQKADFVVYPSYYGEGIPRVMLEAAAAGKPIITADSPGCRETVDEGVNGFLVPVKNVKATAAAIKTLIQDPVLRKEMGQASRAKAEREFDICIVVEQTLDIYKRAFSS